MADCPPISVITVTRRPSNWLRCIETVEAQSYPGHLQHLFLVDDRATDGTVLHPARRPDHVQLVHSSRSSTDVDGPSRLAHLRNEAISYVGPGYIAFLDDDNSWEPDHLESLWSTARTTRAEIVHSQRRLFEEDGRPYVRPEFPWGRDEISRRAIYAYCVAAGIMEPGSNIVRDRFEMRFTWIDLGEWLFPPGFFPADPFDPDYGAWDWFNISVEDKSLPRLVYESGMRCESTGKATLRYYLGGYTNRYDGGGLYWQRPLTRLARSGVTAAGGGRNEPA